MNKVMALLRLTRIEHSIMLIVAVVTAELIAGGLPPPVRLAASLVTPFLISAGAFAINDYYDVESDVVNKKKDRPIVNGSITKNSAKKISLFCLVVGVAVSALINVPAFIVALLFALLAFLYSYRIKDMLLLGNLYIAMTYAIPFIFGAVVTSGTVPLVIALLCLITFLSGLARELHGMVRDREGDRIARKTSNVVAHAGVRRTLQYALILYLEAIAVSVFLFFYFVPFRFNVVYLLFMALADIIILYVSLAPIFKPDAKILVAGRNLSLVAMTVALFGYLFSVLFYLPLAL